MTINTDNENIPERFAKQGVDLVSKLIGELATSAVVNQVLSRAFEVGERAAHVQETAFNTLNIPTGGDVERLTGRIRSLNDRVEDLEEQLNRLNRSLKQIKQKVDSLALEE